MKKIILLYSLILSWGLSYAQDIHEHDHKTCGTMEHLEIMKKSDPTIEARMEEMDRASRERIANSNFNSRMAGSVIKIPVVVHVLYNVASQNISDAQIYSQIDVLNKDFRRMNSDTANTPAMFKPVAADLEVEFCLATRDPNGNATTGITRTSTWRTVFSQQFNSAKYTATGGKDAWPTGDYLNIWVCNLPTDLLGYAQFPGHNAITDGVVVDFIAFGTMGTAQAPYNLGRATTHEVGHWLNLYHVWGDDDGLCSGTDQVDDTPNQGDKYFGCPPFPQISCGSEDMFMNFMDYTNDNCSNLFTTGQKARVQDAVLNYRSSLLTSLGCLSGAPVAEFSVDYDILPPNCQVNFTDISVGPATSWEWHFEGGNPGISFDQNPQNVHYANLGDYDVTLIVNNLLGTDTLTIPDYIYVSPTPLPDIDFMTSNYYPCTYEAVSLYDDTEFCSLNWKWKISPSTYSFVNGTSEASQYPQLEFTAPGEYNITLVVGNGNGKDSLTKASYILVGGRELPFSEDFENFSNEKGIWSIENPDEDNTWEIIDVSGSAHHGSKSATVQIFGTNSLKNIDRLITAPFNLENETEAYLSFEHAYAQYETSYSDSLNVYISGDCGSSWTRIFTGGDDGSGNFATHAPLTTSFIPVNADDWCGSGFGSQCTAIDISSWAGLLNVKIMFETFSFISNNIYLDNISITKTTGIDDSFSREYGFSVYPNPSNGFIYVNTDRIEGTMEIQTLDIQGKVVGSVAARADGHQNQIGIDNSRLAPGMYFIRLIPDNGLPQTRKIFID